MKNKVIRTMCIVLIVLGIIFLDFHRVNASLGSGFDKNLIHEETVDSTFKSKVQRISNTDIVVLQVLSVVGVVITGFRYMIADGSKKGEIKETLIWMCVGLLFVTSANVIINIVTNAGIQSLGN